MLNYIQVRSGGTRRLMKPIQETDPLAQSYSLSARSIIY